MNKLIYITFFAILFTNFNLIQSDELLEKVCGHHMDCKEFQHSGIVSYCMQSYCECLTATGETVKCKPRSKNVNNIMGGHCPCPGYRFECDNVHDTCYCARDYMPSSDRRRCIEKLARLGEHCEEDLQCQSGDYNAICHPDLKKCYCKENFINDEGKCASIIGKDSFCSDDFDCLHSYGINTKCLNDTEDCVCQYGFLVSADNSKCLEIVRFHEKCTESIQCLGSLGIGGKCIDNVCKCSEKYNMENKKMADGCLESICTPFVKRGQYCRDTQECYQHQLNETEQAMTCIYGECDCKKGFLSHNNTECVRGGSEILTINNWYILISVIGFVNIILN